MIECTEIIPVVQNFCIGIATIFMPKIGLEINNIKIFQKGEQNWISLPSKMYEIAGKKKFVPYVQFKDAETQKKFMVSVKDAIDKKIDEMKNKMVAQEGYLI